MKDLSILIPTYNYDCSLLVDELRCQADALGIGYEIIVADDGSTDAATVSALRAIGQWPHCRLDERPQNVGRAAIRNHLARQARYEWLLFIDSDMVIPHADFLQRYADASAEGVVDGGVCISLWRDELRGNLRFLYEKNAEHRHTPERRRLSPYRDFHTANFLVRRDIMLAHPFDERFRHYGYEDVLFGKLLEQHRIPISHIDNPLRFEVFEPNDVFISKTEEGLRTLHQFRAELRGYSRLLDHAEALPRRPLRWCHRLFGSLLRRHLTGRHPRLFLFQLYRLGYFSSLT